MRPTVPRRGVLVLATTAVAATATAVVLGADPAASAPRPRPSGPAVALLTGDTVAFVGGDTAKPVPLAGAGRAGMRFSISVYGGHTFVVPVDAEPLVANGTLDRQLFDVTLLKREGLATKAEVPLIVQGGGTSPAGTHGGRALRSIGGAAVKVNRGDDTFWTSTVRTRAVRKVWLDSTLRLALKESVPQIGGPAAWSAGWTGQGVKVGVLDSGVDATHPDLAGRIAAGRNFTPEASTDDLAGHGTHVAATIASVDATYRGVAPDASLVIGKVCDRTGACEMSGLLEAMEWASTEQHAKVVNMSMGGPDSPGEDPIEQAINRLTAQNGTLFVLGSGNGGGEGRTGTVAAPSTADTALSVGAVDKSDHLATFSGVGPRLGDGAIKPDVTAPGVDIVAARAANGSLGRPGDEHASGTGTSMSSPHAAGAAAVVFSQHPDWTPARIKALLIGSATSTSDKGVYAEGAGRIDLAKAIATSVIAEQPSVAFGTAAWPHGDDEPLTRTVTYRNTGTSDVTLHLGVTATGPDGAAAAGVFALSTDTLTVPADSTAQLTVTATTGGDRPDGAYGGVVTATVGTQHVRTPVAVIREVESYDLVVHPLDRSGAPTTRSGAMLGDRQGDGYTPIRRDDDGTLHFRLPAGTYSMTAGIDGESGNDLIVAPNLRITADTELTADARTTTPVTVTVPRAGARPAELTVGWTNVADDGGQLASWLDTGGNIDGVRTAQLGPDAPDNRFAGALQTIVADPGADGTFTDSPYVYNLAWFTTGKMYTGTRQVRDSALATVRTTNLPVGTGTFAFKGSSAFSTELAGAGFPMFPLLPMSLPGQREELFSTQGVDWFTVFQQATPEQQPDYDVAQLGYGRAYSAGRQYRERWNGGSVAGPSLPGDDTAGWARQVPQGLAFDVPLFGRAADIAGSSRTDTAATVVTRDGVEVCRSEKTGCRLGGAQPAGRYRVHTTAARSVDPTSTRVDVTWDVTNDGRTAALPVQVVRFSPVLSDENAAPGGRVFAVPVRVRRNPGAAASPVRSLTVWASVDDGAHWTRVPVVEGVALVRNPGSGFVSLKATAVDAAGNSVEQTIVRAYRIR